MITLYGIANCDTLRKARGWLDENGIVYQFHDYKRQGLERDRLVEWVNEFGWEALINRKGTTWRRLAPEVRDSIDEAGAITLMLDKPSIIRRPLLDTGSERLLGFDAQHYGERLT